MFIVRWMSLPLVFAAALFVVGCDDTVLDPFVESPFNYSIFGYLDGGVDTQFVRVSPVRDSIALGPDPIDATVTLEHVATGQTMVLHDSLFLYQTALARFNRPGHNFWTAEPILPLQTYRLTVTRSDGATSRATVTLPDTFPDPVIVQSPDPRFAPSTITIIGVERLADVRVIYRVRARGTTTVFKHTISYLDSVRPARDGLVVLVDLSRAEQVLRNLFSNGGPIEIRHIAVTVAAAGPDWPDLTEIDPETLALPDVVSNVEAGVGYLGGVVSKTLPWPGFEAPLTPGR